MKYEDIIKEIKAGLTGDESKDTEYLMAQSEKYREHKYAKEILRECGRMIYEIVPDAKKANLDKIVNEQNAEYRTRLNNAIKAHREGRLDESQKIIEQLIKEIEDMNWYQDDTINEYHHFNEFLEEALYKEYNKLKKIIRQPDFPLEKIYFEYGSLLIDLKRPADAEKALATAMKWNPADVAIALEHSESLKCQGKFEDYFEESKKAFKYAFRPKDLAHCYRNVGFYFSEKEIWMEAACCYAMSLQFDKESQIALSELQYIYQRAGQEVVDSVNADYMKETCKKYGFSFGPDVDVLGIAFAYGEQFAKEGEKEGAKYCFQIVYDLTGDKVVEKKIKELG